MQLLTMGRLQAECLPADPDTHILSIRTPGAFGMRAELEQGFGNVMYLALPDTDDVADFDHYAPRVVKFVLNALEKAKVLVVHCEMGISRSVGIARGISEALDVPYESRNYGNTALKIAVRNALRAAQPQEVANDRS